MSKLFLSVKKKYQFYNGCVHTYKHTYKSVKCMKKRMETFESSELIWRIKHFVTYFQGNQNWWIEKCVCSWQHRFERIKIKCDRYKKILLYFSDVCAVQIIEGMNSDLCSLFVHFWSALKSKFNWETSKLIVSEKLN